MDVRFRLLGPAEISVGDETVVLPSNKPCVVLATLLLNANAFVSAERLQRAVWGGSPPDTARATLQTYVLRLRQFLARHGTGDGPIRTLPRGYAIEASADTLDVLRFRALSRTARVQAEAGDLRGESASLDAALALWRGPALGNLDICLRYDEELPRLEEERLALVERRVDVQLGLGRHREVIAELRSLTTRHPHRERFAELLVTALYRCGRQSEALAESRRIRTLLLDELGIDPGPALRTLEMTILRGEPATTATAPVTATVSAGTAGRLPPDTAGLVGRDRVAERIGGDLVAGTDLAAAVLSGPPGVGKTALAVHIAHRVRAAFPDGQWFVRLRTDDGDAREPGDVLAELLGMLAPGARAAPVGADASTATAAAAYRSALSGRRVLLVLDDADSIAQVQPLLPGTAGSAVLLTSRTGLVGLTVLWGIRSHPLAPLQPEDSVRLLRDLLGSAAEPADPDVLKRLARVCGGLPLALRIAAARFLHRRHHDLAEFVAWLHTDTVTRLSLGGSAAVSVRAAFDTSAGRLGADARRAFVLVGTGPVDGMTVGRLADLLGLAEARVETLLDELFDASLLVAASAGRFTAPDLLRRYALDLAAEALPTIPVGASTPTCRTEELTG